MTYTILICYAIWYTIGFLLALSALRREADITVGDMVAIMIFGILGPITMFIFWIKKKEDKIIFKKRK